MKLLDKVAKRFGYGKIRKRSTAGFAAAAINRLLNDWGVGTLSADSEIRKDLERLRSRSRDLRDDNDYARKFLFMLKSNVLGESGIAMRNRAKDPDRVQGGKLIPGPLDVYANKVIGEAWREWCYKENCTASKTLTWFDVEKIGLETAAVDGEVIVRKVKGFDNPFGFTLELFEADHLDIELNKDLGNGREIRMGVELNEWKQPVAYHFLRKNPNDTFFGGSGQRYERIDAQEIVHPFIRYRAGQTRGLPWMSTAMTRMQHLDKYEEAEQIAARVSADKMGFFEREQGDMPYEGEDDGTGNKIMNAEPGAFEILPAGLKLSSWDPKHPTDQFGTFVKACLRGIAGGLGNVSYNTLANDMESVNFASGKLGLDEERRGWRMIRQWLIDSFHQPIFDDWLEMAILSGKVPLPMSKYDKFNAPMWRGPSWGFVDPTKETQANVQQLAACLTSPQRILAKQQEDWEEVVQEMAEFKERVESYGLNANFGGSPITQPEEPDPVDKANTKE